MDARGRTEYLRKAKKLDSPTSLTEFAPLSSEVKAEGSGFSLSRFFRKSKANKDFSKDGESPANSLNPIKEATTENETTGLVVPDSAQVAEIVKQQRAKSATNPELSMTLPPEDEGREWDVLYTRSMTGVLRRIASIIDRGMSAPQAYEDSDFKQYWMPDSNCKECYECGDKFTTFRRRHHCRICGQIFCSRCCNQEIPGKVIGCRGDLRVCTYCCKVVLTYLRSLDVTSDLPGDLRDLQAKLGVLDVDVGALSSPDSGTWGSTRRKTSLGFREEALVVQKSDTSEFSPSDLSGLRSPSPGRVPIQDQIFLRELWAQIQHPIHGVVFQTHRHRLHAYANCIVGNELVDWLVAQGKASSRSQACAMGQALVNNKLLESVVSNDQVFIDGYALYRPGYSSQFDQSPVQPASPPTETVEESQDPLWVSEIQPTGEVTPDMELDDSIEIVDGTVAPPDQPRSHQEGNRLLTTSTSTFFLNLDLKESRVTVSRPREPLSSSPDKEFEDSKSSRWDVDIEAASGELSSRTIPDDCVNGALYASKGMGETVKNKHIDDTEIKESHEKLNSSYKNLEKDMLNQLLVTENLPLSWADIILPIVHKVSGMIRPDVKNDDDMDIRQYVHVKKIPGGNKSECCVVHGVVCTKNVVHKKMKQQILNPRILLVGSSIVYQRVENKLSSLDPIIMQECEYLKNVVAKIKVFQPDLLLVEKTVSRLAQEKLLEMDITLAINIKPSVMERVSRCTGSTIVSSIDAQLGKPNLGTCQNFSVKSFLLALSTSKTLFFFDGCSSNLGCTILLRGGSFQELKKVKLITQFMLYMAYNWHLELCFLMDEFALPSVKTYIADDDDILGSRDNVAKDKSVETLISSAVNMVVDGQVTTTKDVNLSSSFIEKSDSVLTEEVVRKIEKSKVEDFSDPLRSYQDTDEDLVHSESKKVPVKDIMRSFSSMFKNSLDSTILCCSPFIKVTLPYLETEAGRSCELRKFFGEEIYWSPKLNLSSVSTRRKEPEELSIEIMNPKPKHEGVLILPLHPFTFQKLTSTIWESLEAQAMLADFRARGGRILALCPHEIQEKQRGKVNMYDRSAYSDSCWDGKIDALNPFNHQRLAVLFCNYSPTSINAPYFCVNPWVVNMDFYGRNDIPLGGFLERYCFRSSYRCPSETCDTPMLEHVRKFAHENGCIQILLHHLENPLPAAQNSILMWSWCRKCRFVTPLVTMSDDTWLLSFAKYLELQFHGHMYGCRNPNNQCPHSIHHDHYQYFALKQIVASFKYTSILMREVVLPPPVISIQDQLPHISSIVDEIRDLTVKGYRVYSSILETICSLKSQSLGVKFDPLFAEMMEQQQEEKTALKEKIEDIQLKLTSPSLKRSQSQEPNVGDSETATDVCVLTWKILDNLVLLKQFIADAVYTWNKKFHDFEVSRKKDERSLAKINQLSKQMSITADTYSNVEEIGHSPVAKIDLNDTIETCSSFEDSEYCPDAELPDVFASTNVIAEQPEEEEAEGKAEDGLDRAVADSDKNSNTPASLLRISSSSSSISSYMYSVSPGIYAGLMGQDQTAQQSDSYAVYHAPQPQQLEDSTESVKRAGGVTRGHERSRSDGAEKVLESRARLSTPPKLEDELTGSKPEKRERGSVKTIISQLLSSSATSMIQSPFSPSEHFIVSRNDRIPIVIYDQEQSSIIAHALASADYEQQLFELQNNLSAALSQLREQPAPSPTVKRQKSDSCAENYSVHSDVQSVDFDDLALCSSQESEKKGGHKNPNMHIETQFSDSTSQFYCRIYFAEQFRKLRYLVFPQGEERFIRSLSRCVSWSAQGGKSGSSFCKTHDDRFILKQMSRYENQSFLEFAPHYFQYINKACTNQQPTVLAKIVGVFRIGYKNTATNAASKLDLLVMENLFYKRNIAQKFDLKGSVRNRLVNTRTQTEDIVLLDENLLKMTCDSPLYIRPHSKTVLTLAINNDAQFLSENSVMDYSLLVGFDSDKKELVVGIIDYIRTFTWDKKLEMVVKSTWAPVKSTLRGHGNKLPTIVSPDIYRVRFCEAMDKYFLCVPDRWSGLGRGVDC